MVKKTIRRATKKEVVKPARLEDEYSSMAREIIVHVDKKFEEYAQTAERHLGILREDFDHKLQLVAESVSLLGGTTDRIETRMDGMEGKMDRIETRMDGMEGKMDRIETRMDGMETQLDKMESTLEVHTELLGQLNESVHDIKHDLARKVGRDEFEKLEKRVLTLELQAVTTPKR